MRAFGVGLNYRSHLERLGSAAPAHPLAYLKPDSALVGADDEIAYPAMTEQLDYEVELVAVLARPWAMSCEPLAVCLATRWATISVRGTPGGVSLASTC